MHILLAGTIPAAADQLRKMAGAASEWVRGPGRHIGIVLTRDELMVRKIFFFKISITRTYRLVSIEK